VLADSAGKRRNLWLGALALLVLWFCWYVRSVLNPLLLGYLLAYIVHPWVQRLQARGLSQRAAVNLIFVAAFLGATLVLATVGWQLRSLALEVVESAGAPSQAPAAIGAPSEEPVHFTLAERLQLRLDEFSATLGDWGLDVHWTVPDLEALREQVDLFLQEHGDQAGRAGLAAAGRGLGLVARFLGGVLSVTSLFLLVPLYSYYFLFVLATVHGTIRRYLPRGERERLTRVAERVGRVIASFFRGRLSVAFLKGVFLAVGLTLAGMPYGILFGMLSGFLSIIPFVGAFGGFVAACLVGVLDHGVIGSLVRSGVVFGLGEIVEGYVLVPRILGDELGLHPLVVFFALLAGGAALGMLGLLIALPLTAALVILFQEFVAPSLRELAEET